MATQSVEWTSCEKLCFTGNLPVDVVLCIPSELVAPHLCPESGDDQPFPFSHIDATLESIVCVSDICGRRTWRYTFTYDDSQLVEGTVLNGLYITGVFIKNCFTSWVEELTGNEVYIQTEEDYSQSLVSQHGCVYPLTGGGGSPFCLEVEDTPSIDLTLDQNDDSCYTLTADVKIANTLSNCISILPTGLYVQCPPAPYCLEVQDTPTVDLTLEDIDNCNVLSAAVEISADAENCIEARGDGLYVPCAEAGFITSVTDTNTVDLTVAVGALSADVEISADVNNCLEARVDGLYVPCAAADFITAISDTPTVNLTNTAGTLTADVIVSPDADNLITAEANGIKVDNCADYQNRVVAPTAAQVMAVETIVGDETNPAVDTNQYTFAGNVLTISNASTCRTMLAKWEVKFLISYSLLIPVTELTGFAFDYRFEIALQLNINGAGMLTHIVYPVWKEQDFLAPSTDTIYHTQLIQSVQDVVSIAPAGSFTVQGGFAYSAISMTDNRALMTVNTSSYIYATGLGVAV